ncbi:transglycosylase SLT domain-containing protein [Pararhodobacter aggregans]|uniref:transglycosylase SLT domain-containing protein n=1 Tax=Pararhodobacter aggregans TaxID=404875 RepID=UPI003A92E747
MKTSRPLQLLAFLGLALLAAPASARPELCESAAVTAARETGVPLDVLLAIALTETGRSRDGTSRPWPWTANAEGRGHWFDTREEAARFARSLLARGQDLFDLGCFQINWHWHGQQFRQPEDLLDPLTAARYAARLLASLHEEFGSWEGAAGAYHSRNPTHAERYRARFRSLRAGLDASPPPPPVAERVNTFPLLAGTPAGASLVPLALPSSRPLIEALP